LKLRFVVALVACLGVSALATAASLKGTIANGTTGKPAAGDEVVLISLANGMSEVAHSKVDASGNFSFKLADEKASHLVRVIHQGVPYHAMASPGASSVDVRVYDVAQKLDAVTVLVHTQRFQAAGDTLQVSEVITVQNASEPPRTLMNDRPFQLWLPRNARLDAGLAQAGSANPLKFMPSPGDGEGEYYFRFPLRPGQTRFAVAYRLPYSGEAVIEPKVLYPLERFAVVVPKSMVFQPKTAGIFKPVATEADADVQVTAAMKPGEQLSFRVSGRGMLTAVQGAQQQAPGTDAARPGGGLGAPTELPDPLHNYRWAILGGLAVVLFAGGMLHAIKRPRMEPTRGRRHTVAALSA
jgi:hypothetical protein